MKGVYLLVDVESGQQYVGSAKGADSLLGRWLEYANGGDGGDVRSRPSPATAAGTTRCPCWKSSTATPPTTPSSRSKARWKYKLLTRRFGLNGN